MKRLLRSFSYAFKGIGYVISTQQSMRIHLVCAALAIVAGFVVQLEPLEWAVILILIGLVLALECINTALETVVDRYSTEVNPLSRIAKDTAAGAVLIIAIISVVVGIIIYVNALVRLLT